MGEHEGVRGSNVFSGLEGQFGGKGQEVHHLNGIRGQMAPSPQ